jgi:hypothetical protein
VTLARTELMYFISRRPSLPTTFAFSDAVA